MKTDKSITGNENYGIISLMNIDTRIFNINKLNSKHIKKTIHHDEVGCTPGKQDWFNTPKLIN